MRELIEISLRTIAAFGIIMLMLRIMGKQAISHLNYNDYITVTIAGTLAGNMAFNLKFKPTIFILALALVTLISLSITFLENKQPKARKWIEGIPHCLIDKGQLNQDVMKQEHFTVSLLSQELREKGIFDINEVEQAVLEHDGSLSVLKKQEFRSLIYSDLAELREIAGRTAKNAPHDSVQGAVEIIMNGSVLQENLLQNNLSMDWLQQELTARELTLIDVSYAVQGSNGQLYFYLKGNNVGG